MKGWIDSRSCSDQFHIIEHDEDGKIVVKHSDDSKCTAEYSLKEDE